MPYRQTDRADWNITESLNQLACTWQERETHAPSADENVLSSLLPFNFSFSVFNLRLEGWVTGVCGWMADRRTERDGKR
jgi:hypothetical protein